MRSRQAAVAIAAGMIERVSSRRSLSNWIQSRWAKSAIQ